MAPAAVDELPIVQYWHSKEIPADVAALIATFAEHNPERPHLVFDRNSAEDFIAAHFSTREVTAFRTCAVAAMQADYLRYCAAHVLGGVCVDADCRCVAPLQPMLDEGSGRIFRWGGVGGVLNGLLVFGQPRHPLPKLALDVATANIENRRLESVAATTGPVVLNTLLRFRHDGSFEATLEQTDHLRWKKLFEEFRSAIGAYERLPEAFAGVLVRPHEEITNWIRNPDTPPQYKYTVHWTDPGTSIFHEADSI